jgi:hypothetical protein
MALRPLAVLALALGLALGPAAAPAAAQEPEEQPQPAEPALAAAAAPAPPSPACPPRTPRIRLFVRDPEPVLSAEFGVDALHAETGRPRSATAHHLGLTTSRVEWRSEINARTATDRRGVCATPDRVELTLVQSEHRVRIAREIPRGGCLFREVEAHERRHVAVNRRTVAEAALRARRAAETWAATAEGRGATEAEALAALQAGLRRAIEPALAAMRQAREAAHRAIDAESEYRRLAQVCPEDQRALRERLRARLAD